MGAATGRARMVAFDAFRGLAILLMVLDHVVLVTGGPDLIRATLTRAAMPAFFLLAGYLATRPRRRHLGLALVGLFLPVAVPWVDNPNVLCLWALGVVVLWLCDRWGVSPWVVVVLALTVAANGWATYDEGYHPLSMVALMAVGSMLPAAAFTWAGRAPAWVAAVGRHPVAWYLGHLLVLEGLVLLVAAS